MLFTLTLMFAFWLAWTPLAMAQSGDIPTRDRTNRHHLVNRHHNNGFDGISLAVNVSGTIIVDEAIVLELTIKPTDEIYNE